jgi:hypothetical protein
VILFHWLLQWPYSAFAGIKSMTDPQSGAFDKGSGAFILVSMIIQATDQRKLVEIARHCEVLREYSSWRTEAKAV